LPPPNRRPSFVAEACIDQSKKMMDRSTGTATVDIEEPDRCCKN
jgi:hypothetical protein